MVIQHSKPIEMKFREVAYLIQLPTGLQEVVRVLPWLTEMAAVPDTSIETLKGQLEHTFNVKVELQYKPQLTMRLFELQRKF
jgi:hypothetical protein